LKPGFAGTPVESVAEVVRQSMDHFIGAQKSFLEAAEKHTGQAVQEFGEGKRLDGSRLAELARQAGSRTQCMVQPDDEETRT
jgi:hypothetical protein